MYCTNKTYLIWNETFSGIFNHCVLLAKAFCCGSLSLSVFVIKQSSAAALMTISTLLGQACILEMNRWCVFYLRSSIFFFRHVFNESFFRFLWWKRIFALQLCFLLISVMNPRFCTMSLGHNFPWYWTTCRVYKSWKEDQTSAHFKDMSRRTNNMLVAVVLIATLTSSVSIQNTSNVFEVSVMKFW